MNANIYIFCTLDPSQKTIQCVCDPNFDKTRAILIVLAAVYS